MTSRLRPLLGAWLICLSLAPGRAEGQAAELGEFRQRRTATFNSAGHPKAAGLEVGLLYPRSWRATEANPPHIVQNFNPSGAPAICNLLIKNAAPEMTESELRAAVHPSRITEQAPAGAERISSQATVLDRLPAAELMFETGVSRPRVNLRVKTIIFIAAYQTNLIQLTCSAGGTSEAETAARFAAYLPLYRLIAGSITVHDPRRPAR